MCVRLLMKGAPGPTGEPGETGVQGEPVNDKLLNYSLFQS